MAFIKAFHVTVTPNIGGATIPPARLASKNAGLSSLYARAYFCIASSVTLVVAGGYSRPTPAMFSGIDWLRFLTNVFQGRRLYYLAAADVNGLQLQRGTQHD